MRNYFECCLNCKGKRSPYCHSSCEDYGKARKALDEDNKKRREEGREYKEYTREKIIAQAKADAHKGLKKRKAIY